jgi:hypothetical protein
VLIAMQLRCPSPHQPRQEQTQPLPLLLLLLLTMQQALRLLPLQSAGSQAASSLWNLVTSLLQI